MNLNWTSFSIFELAFSFCVFFVFVFVFFSFSHSVNLLGWTQLILWTFQCQNSTLGLHLELISAHFQLICQKTIYKHRSGMSRKQNFAMSPRFSSSSLQVATCPTVGPVTYIFKVSIFCTFSFLFAVFSKLYSLLWLCLFPMPSLLLFLQLLHGFQSYGGV